jgi:hypothetical protein
MLLPDEGKASAKIVRLEIREISEAHVVGCYPDPRRVRLGP